MNNIIVNCEGMWGNVNQSQLYYGGIQVCLNAAEFRSQKYKPHTLHCPLNSADFEIFISPFFCRFLLFFLCFLFLWPLFASCFLSCLLGVVKHLRKATVSFVMFCPSVFLSTWNNSTPHWTEFVEHFPVSLTEVTGNVHQDVCALMKSRRFRSKK